MNWQQWITEQYLAWRRDKPGRAGSAASYAREIGFDPAILSSWMNRGSTPREMETIHKLAAYFGPVIYEVLQIPQVDYISVDKLPSELGSNLKMAILEIASELNKYSIDPESIEAAEISRAILNKRLLTVKTIKKSG
ncbi:MAG: hypothetical protein WC837_04565 [Bellilinea sp.]